MTWLLALYFHIPPHILAGVERVESRGNPWAVSRSGCIGVMQVCPHWSPVPWPLLFVPQINRAEAARQLAYWHKRAHSWRRAVAAYRCGNAGLRGRCGRVYASLILR
jgi:soluble lytic murein transglycosylase-like protein